MALNHNSAMWLAAERRFTASNPPPPRASLLVLGDCPTSLWILNPNGRPTSAKAAQEPGTAVSLWDRSEHSIAGHIRLRVESTRGSAQYGYASVLKALGGPRLTPKPARN